MTEPQLLIMADAAAQAAAGAAWLAERILAATRRRETCFVALAGGRTPRPIYELLAAPPLAGQLPWERIRFCFGDERCVPPDDPASNFRMAREALGTPARLRRIEAERPDREAAAAAYDASLPAALDVVVLGLGADGHTASLFPGSAALRETRRGYVATRAPVAPVDRITITPPRLAAAGEILVVASGAEKAAAAERALRGNLDVDVCPAQLARRGTWLLDAAAAARRVERGDARVSRR